MSFEKRAPWSDSALPPPPSNTCVRQHHRIENPRPLTQHEPSQLVWRLLAPLALPKTWIVFAGGRELASLYSDYKHAHQPKSRH